MGSSDDDGGFSLIELYVVKFVLADVVIIAALLFAGPIYAVTITALLIVSVFLVWYLTERVGADDSSADSDRREWEREQASSTDDRGGGIDPVTTLQERYASGDITEIEFERTLDQLLEADERAEAAGVETERLSLERDQ
ncbi:SHOCT domain-containing protein [Halovivax gelatinilyticus]|uniref:SHOCT domain-containing protein n=1 Tax=Halovivax gelatinilyticus TaxID=2961597 RepID=UPI0020CA66F7|nr:SHOCT domain-containing protein [Halovivax gelatinilyticus]